MWISCSFSPTRRGGSGSSQATRSKSLAAERLLRKEIIARSRARFEIARTASTSLLLPSSPVSRKDQMSDFTGMIAAYAQRNSFEILSPQRISVLRRDSGNRKLDGRFRTSTDVMFMFIRTSRASVNKRNRQSNIDSCLEWKREKFR